LLATAFPSKEAEHDWSLPKQAKKEKGVAETIMACHPLSSHLQEHFWPSRKRRA
jgi:hypothetical protein